MEEKKNALGINKYEYSTSVKFNLFLYLSQFNISLLDLVEKTEKEGKKEKLDKLLDVLHLFRDVIYDLYKADLPCDKEEYDNLVFNVQRKILENKDGQKGATE